MTLIIQKYMSNSIKTLENIQTIARRIFSTNYSGSQVIALVSPIYEEQERLAELARSIQLIPKERELATLLAVSGQVVTALVAQAVIALGGHALSLNMIQAGMLTTDSYDNAYLIKINTALIFTLLKNRMIPIMIDNYGISANNEITLLEVTEQENVIKKLASSLRAERYLIYQTIDEVYSNSPSIFQEMENNEQLYQQEYAW